MRWPFTGKGMLTYSPSTAILLPAALAAAAAGASGNLASRAAAADD
jgi:hypothetical protein